MTTKNDFVQYKLSKAENSLKAAEILYNNSLPQEAISKLYYSVFNAVNALLINVGLFPKTHAGTKALFHKEFILKGLISLETGKLYDNLMAKRFEADYESFTLIDPKEIPVYISEVKLFIVKVKEIIENKE